MGFAGLEAHFVLVRVKTKVELVDEGGKGARM